jgi:hypothetical protein
MAENKHKSNPVADAALDAAKNHIDGFEAGTDSFNEIAAEQLREGDPRAINQVRKNRKNIKQARDEFGLE